jgi:hypothetical protein
VQEHIRFGRYAPERQDVISDEPDPGMSVAVDHVGFAELRLVEPWEEFEESISIGPVPSETL